MALAAELMDQLKHELKSNGVTYKDVGEALEISESSVKRLFRDQDMSLSRLERICGCLLYTSPSPRDLSTSRMPSSA